MKMARSPHRGSFSKARYEDELLKDSTNESAALMIEHYDSIVREDIERENDPKWQKNNLEYDLRTSEWIVEKCRSDVYAQNLYAALCNNTFTRNDIWPILKEQIWHCSWRYAGGIVAHLRGEGDYIDWYCSGIRHAGPGDTEEDSVIGYVTESIVTDEIRDDLLKLGWLVQPWGDNDE